MGVHRFFLDFATRPQVKQMNFGVSASVLIRSNCFALARTQRWPLCSLDVHGFVPPQQVSPMALSLVMPGEPPGITGFLVEMIQLWRDFVNL